MAQDKFEEFFLLQNKAKTLEKQGNSKLALDTYLDIINNYSPYNDFSYDRAVILLEHKRDFDMAIVICQKAIDGLAAGDFEGDIQKFKDRLSKLQGKAIENKPVDDTKYKFGFPGFRSENILHKIFSSLVIIAALLVSIPDNILQFVFLIGIYLILMLIYEIIVYMIQRKKISISLISLIVVLVITFSSFSFMPKDDFYSFLNINMDKEGVIGLNPGTGESEPTPEEDITTPEITEDILKKARASIEIEPAVVETVTVLEASRLNLLIYVQPSTTAEESKRIAEKFGRNVGSLMTSEGLTGSNKDYFGEIYEYYEYVVLVKDTFEDDIVTGQLSSDNSRMNWTEAE